MEGLWLMNSSTLMYYENYFKMVGHHPPPILSAS
jgi:hypothetical protein